MADTETSQAARYSFKDPTSLNSCIFTSNLEGPYIQTPGSLKQEVQNARKWKSQYLNPESKSRVKDNADITMMNS